MDSDFGIAHFFDFDFITGNVEDSDPWELVIVLQDLRGMEQRPLLTK